jgi:hypothetical protein
MPALSGIEGCHGSYHFVPVLWVPSTDFRDGGHHFSGHTEATGDVVPHDVVCDESEARSQRARVAAGLGAR